MRRLLLLGTLCAMCVLAITPAAGAATYAYGSCAEIPTQEMAQNTLDDPTYGTYGADKDELNLDPDGDGVACNNPGNLVGGDAPEEPECTTAEECGGGQYEAQYGQPETPTQGDQYRSNGNLTVDDVVEEAAENAAEGAPDAAGSLSASREAAFGATREARADEQVAEKEGTPSSEGGAGEEEEANAYGGITELPATGGVSLALGACALFLVAGGLVTRRIVG